MLAVCRVVFLTIFTNWSLVRSEPSALMSRRLELASSGQAAMYLNKPSTGQMGVFGSPKIDLHAFTEWISLYLLKDHSCHKREDVNLLQSLLPIWVEEEIDFGPQTHQTSLS